MRKIFLLTFFLIIVTNTYSQEEKNNPTLSVGVEALTFGKGTIDIDALRTVLIRKQNEIKREGVKRFVYKKLPKYNYTSKLFLQNVIEVLINEKNQNIIEKELLELTTNYSLILGFSKIYSSINTDENSAYQKYLNHFQIELNQPDIAKQFYVDIVGSELSSHSQLKKRGFFDMDSKIDYKKSRIYKDIKDNNPSLEDSIIAPLRKNIDTLITTYFESSRYIKEIIDYKDLSKINDLSTYFIGQLTPRFFTENSLLAEYAGDYKNNDLLGMIKIAHTLKNLKTDFRILNEKIENIKQKDIDFIEFEIEVTDDSIYSEDKLEKLLANVSSNKAILENYIELCSQIILNSKSVHNNLKKIKNTNLSFIENESSYISLKSTAESNTRRLTVIGENIESIITLSEAFTEDYQTQKYKLNIKGSALNQWYKDIESHMDKIIVDFDASKLDVFNNNSLVIFENKFKIEEKEVKKKELSNNSALLSYILKSVSDDLLSKNFNNKDSLLIRENADFFTDLYMNSRRISQKDKLTINDVLYFEKSVLPKLVKAKILVTDGINDGLINSALEATRNLIPLMKYSLTPPEFESIKTEKKIISFFEFIGSINKLDKANTFTYILNLLDESHSYFLEINSLGSNGSNSTEESLEFKLIYEKIINAIDKYTIINSKEEIIEIDVLSFLTTIVNDYNKENSYNRNELYFTIGFSQNVFIKNYNITNEAGSKNLKGIGFASEKIGYKYNFLKFNSGKFDNYAEPSIGYSKEIKEPNPFVNEMYFIVYGSGLLYKIANLTTNEEFNFPHIGIGTGFRFYNALDVSFSIGFPFIDNQKFGNNAFMGLSMDIPIGEYLLTLGKNK